MFSGNLKSLFIKRKKNCSSKVQIESTDWKSLHWNFTDSGLLPPPPLRESRESGWGAGRGRGRGRIFRSQAGSTLGVKPHKRFDVTILGSRPEPKSRDRPLTKWATRCPTFFFFFNSLTKETSFSSAFPADCPQTTTTSLKMPPI